MAKNTKKTQDKCPICQKTIIPPNTWLKYHVRYDPPIMLMACKYCNFIEFSLRTNKPIPPLMANMHRINKVIALHSSFGIKL